MLPSQIKDLLAREKLNPALIRGAAVVFHCAATATDWAAWLCFVDNTIEFLTEIAAHLVRSTASPRLSRYRVFDHQRRYAIAKASAILQPQIAFHCGIRQTVIALRPPS